MSDKFIRHLISFMATAVFALVYWAAYTAGGHGWWWAFFVVLLLYPILYKLVDV